MNYDNYLELLQKELKNKMGKDFTVTVTEVAANNGLCLKGITIYAKGQAMTFYPDSQFAEYANSKFEENADNQFEEYLNSQFAEYAKNREERKRLLSEAAGDIIKTYCEQSPEPDCDLGFLGDYEQVKDKVFYRLVNYQKNRVLLAGVPHQRIYDLALTFFCDIQNELSGATVVIDNALLALWDITAARLCEDARRNTLANNPPVVKTMGEALGEIFARRIGEKGGDEEKAGDLLRQLLEDNAELGEKFLTPDGERAKMYIVSNKDGFYGAAALLYPDFLAAFAEQLQADLYILPSSVHEIIIVPADGGENLPEMVKTVREINANQVKPEEALADSVYYFRRETGIIEVLGALEKSLNYSDFVIV